jgi:WD40 repeat protein
LLACGGQDGVLCVFDLTGEAVLRVRATHAWPIRSLAWCSNGQRLAVGDDWDVSIRDVVDGTSQLFRHECSWVDPISWSPDGTWLAYGLWGTNMVRVCRIDNPARSTLLFPVSKELVLALSEQGHVRGSPKWQDAFVYVVETATGQETLTPAVFAARFGFRNDPSLVRFPSSSSSPLP